MSCQQHEEKWFDYLEGALPENERRVLQEHIDVCRECAERLDGYRRSWDALQALDAPAAPQCLKERVLAAVADAVRENVRVERSSSHIATPWWRRAWVPLAAAAMVLVVVGVMMMWDSPSTGGFEDLSAEDQQLVANLDLLEDLDLLENLDLLEEWETLEQMDDIDLDELASIVGEN